MSIKIAFAAGQGVGADLILWKIEEFCKEDFLIFRQSLKSY